MIDIELKRLPWALVFAGVTLLLATALVWSQTTTGYIVGVAKDSTGAVIPGANLTLTEIETGTTRSVISDTGGAYSFRQLPPGRYRLSAELTGFKRFVQEPIIVRVNEATRVDPIFEVGQLSEQVVVQSTGIQVQTTNSTLGAVVEEKKVVELPLNGRNFVQLGLLQAGVTEGGPQQTSVTSTMSTFSVNGVRTQNNNFMVDGVMAGSVENNALEYRPNPDTIREFKIQTNTYSAEFGRAPGGVVNVVTKSGTNEFHGSAWEFLRNEVLDARNFFASSVPVNKRNQYGVSLGGPIAKDKTFFFAAWEGFKLRRGTARTTIVPTAAEKSGDFSALSKMLVNPFTGDPFSNNRIPDALVDPAAKLLVKLYPDPNIGGATPRANNFSSAPGVPTDQFNVMGRIDHRLTTKDTVSARYFIDSLNARVAFQGPSNLPTFYQENTGYRQHVVLNHTRVFSPTLVNDLRAGFARTTTTGVYYPIVPARQYGINLDTPEGVGLPAFEITGMAGLGNVIQGPSAFAFNTFQYLDTVSLTKGRHQLSMGGEFRKTQENVVFRFTHNGSYQMTGTFTGDAFADFMIGKPQTFTLGTGRPFLAQRNTSFSVFLQDDLKVTPKLTLNLGVRYDLYTPIHDIRKETSALFVEKMATPGVPQSGGLIIDAPGTHGLPGQYDVYFADKNDVVPRFGFSYDVFGNGRMAVRGGFGVFVSQEIGNLQLQQLISFPYTNFLVISNATTSDPIKGVNTKVDIKFPFRGTTSQALNTDPYIRHPYYEQYNLNIQMDLGGGWLTEVGYVGSQGKKLLHFREINQPITLPGATRDNKDARRPYKDFSTVILSTDFGASNYNAFQLSLKRRFSAGFTLDSAYTFSKALDLGSQFHAGGQNRYEGVLTQDDNCRNCDRAVAGFDTPHRWVTSFLYELPVGRGKRFLGSAPIGVNKLLGGWQINGILLLKNGWPFTVRDFRDRSLAAGAFIPVDRPNLVGTERVTGDVNKWFDTSAYAAVPLGTFGNLGRNTLRSDKVGNFDFSVFKRTTIPKISEQFAVEFRAEFFNLANTPTFSFPNNDFGSSTPGRIGSTVLDERQIQFALKVIF